MENAHIFPAKLQRMVPALLAFLLARTSGGALLARGGQGGGERLSGGGEEERAEERGSDNRDDRMFGHGGPRSVRRFCARGLLSSAAQG